MDNEETKLNEKDKLKLLKLVEQYIAKICKEAVKEGEEKSKTDLVDSLNSKYSL